MAQHLISAGTDIACVGIWDAGLAPSARPIGDKDLAASAERGEVLPIQTHADGTYLLRIHVDEPYVPPPAQRFETMGREFGLNLGSGTALVGGCEDFRNPRPQITFAADRFHVEPSWYRVQVHLNRTDPELLERLAHREAETALSEEENVRYRQLGKDQHRALFLGLGALGTAILSGVIRGTAGVMGGGVAVLLAGAAFAFARRAKKAGYDSLHARYQTALAAAHEPDVVLVLHRTGEPIPGGSVDLEATAS
ncbi:hypothetical protein [Hyalangium minutum]|uniref:hypothetical protein n=1 Tax=Hyalangium minutum TaxID=394096 RepID=UPI0012F8AE06|nr:hypothetical protein [Hyalangium minutum]